MDERSALRVHGRAARRPDPHTRARAQSRCPGRSARRGSCSRQGGNRREVSVFFSFSFLLNFLPDSLWKNLAHTHPSLTPTPTDAQTVLSLSFLALLSLFSTPERSSSRARGCERAQRLQRPGASLGSGQSGWDPRSQEDSGGELTVFRPLLLLDERGYRGRLSGATFHSCLLTLHPKGSPRPRFRRAWSGAH